MSSERAAEDKDNANENVAREKPCLKFSEKSQIEIDGKPVIMNSFDGDINDIFNLNSFDKEEYYLISKNKIESNNSSKQSSRKSRSKSRSSHRKSKNNKNSSRYSSSSSSDLSQKTSESSGYKSKNYKKDDYFKKTSRRSRSIDSEENETSEQKSSLEKTKSQDFRSNSSLDSNSSEEFILRYKLKSKVILVNKQTLFNNEQSRNSERSKSRSKTNDRQKSPELNANKLEKIPNYDRNRKSRSLSITRRKGNNHRKLDENTKYLANNYNERYNPSKFSSKEYSKNDNEYYERDYRNKNFYSKKSNNYYRDYRNSEYYIDSNWKNDCHQDQKAYMPSNVPQSVNQSLKLRNIQTPPLPCEEEELNSKMNKSNLKDVSTSEISQVWPHASQQTAPACFNPYLNYNFYQVQPPPFIYPYQVSSVPPPPLPLPIPPLPSHLLLQSNKQTNLPILQPPPTLSSQNYLISQSIPSINCVKPSITIPPLNQCQEITSTNSPINSNYQSSSGHSPNNILNQQKPIAQMKNEHQNFSNLTRINVQSTNFNDFDIYNQDRFKESLFKFQNSEQPNHDLKKENLEPVKDLEHALLPNNINTNKSQVMNEISTTNASISSASADSSFTDELDLLNKNFDLKDKKQLKKSHNTNSDKSHKKSKKSGKKKQKSSKNLTKTFEDEKKKSSRIRRSDRIKVIETKKQHYKELEIAEKIKKHSNNIQDSNSNEPTDTSESIETNHVTQNEQKINDHDQKSLTNSLENDLDRIPVKIKDRWRRYSEKEYENSNLSPSLLYLTPPQTTQINLNSPGCNKLELNTQAPASSFNLNSNTDNNTNSPHRAFKKILLDKVVSETSLLTTTANLENAKNTDFDMSELKGLYDHIDENFYATKRKQTKCKKLAMTCDCSTSEQERQLGIVACGEDCLNRMIMIECGKGCPCGVYCTNKNFKNKNVANIQPFKTELKGWGLKANADIKTHSFLIEYVGEVIDARAFKKRMEKYSEKNNQHFYVMSLQNDLFIDATKKGNISRFFNHSCDPNCETQKWTVNGELRIGFFAKKPISIGEELTFDYQFQKVGKVQQKCYCGSEKCRGFLGISTSSAQQNGGAFDHIWDESSDESSDDENDEDDDSDEKSNKENSDSELKNSEITGKNIHKKHINIKNKLKHLDKEHKKKSSNKEDFELNRQIQSIQSLSNKQSVLKLCQLMYRIENVECRLEILDLLLNTKPAGLRLFMDYNGLKLICSWMIDIDNKNGTESIINCKLKMLQVLTKMSIKNKTIVEESKLLDIVKRWSDSSSTNQILTEETEENEAQSQQWIKFELEKIIENAVEISSKENSTNIIKSLADKLKSKSNELYEEWSNLKQGFKIPKKQRIEERKEHERELNSSSEFSPENSTSNTILYENDRKYFSNDKFQFEKRFKHRNRDSQNYDDSFQVPHKRQKQFQKFYDNNFSPSNHNNNSFNNFNQHPHNSSLTKEQRRLLFEQKVKEEEAAAAAQAAALLAKETAEQALQAQQQNQEMKWMYDCNTNQWYQCYATKPTQTQYPDNNLLYYQNHLNAMQPSNLVYSNGLNQHQQPALFATTTPSSLLSATIKQPPVPIEPIAQHKLSIHDRINSINLTESSLLVFKQVLKNFEPVSDLKSESIESPTPTPVQISESKKTVSSSKSKTNATQKKNSLPPNWKCKTNKNGKLYYFNIKTKQSQWSPPKLKRTSEDQSVKVTSTTANIDVSNETEEFKISKEEFRNKLSGFVVKLLQPYSKSDCKFGYIQSKDDFKHLARKFTHTILEKEMVRILKVEDLELNERKKTKTYEYITNYMKKFPLGYSRKIDEKI